MYIHFHEAIEDLDLSGFILQSNGLKFYETSDLAFEFTRTVSTSPRIALTKCDRTPSLPHMTHELALQYLKFAVLV